MKKEKRPALPRRPLRTKCPFLGGQATGLNLSQAPVQRQDLRLFSLLARPEEDFLRLAAELEADPLFKKLLVPGPDGRSTVARRRLPGASYAFVLAASDAALATAAGAGGTAGEWLLARPEMTALARRVGAENFKKYFLSEIFVSPEKAARKCGVTAREVRDLRAFVYAFLLAHERAPIERIPELFLRCVARVEAEGRRLRISYTHPAYFRGAYSVDREAFARLLKSGVLTRAEAARAHNLLRSAQRISWRKCGLHRALSALLEWQKDFLLERGRLKPLTQRSLAAATALNPGTVSRLMAGKTVLTPGGGEVRLKDLFSRKSALIIDKIREVLAAVGAQAAITDREVTAALKAGYGIRISRRSVNLYRSRMTNERNGRGSP